MEMMERQVTTFQERLRKRVNAKEDSTGVFTLNVNEDFLSVLVVENILLRWFKFVPLISVFRSSTAEEPPVMEEDPELDDGDPLCNSFNSFCKYKYHHQWLLIADGRVSGWVGAGFIRLLTRGQLTDPVADPGGARGPCPPPACQK